VIKSSKPEGEEKMKREQFGGIACLQNLIARFSITGAAKDPRTG
jgi:hypothetical protein